MGLRRLKTNRCMCNFGPFGLPQSNKYYYGHWHRQSCPVFRCEHICGCGACGDARKEAEDAGSW